MKKFLILVVALTFIVSGTAFASTVTNKAQMRDSKLKTEYVQAFEAKAKNLGMTMAELKAKNIQDFEAKATAKNMTVVEYKEALAKHKLTMKAWDSKSTEAQAQIKGMTVEEYKRCLSKN